MGVNDLWNRLAGPDGGFDETTIAGKIVVSDFLAVFTSIVVTGAVDQPTGLSTMGIASATDTEQNFLDYVASLETITHNMQQGFPLGEIGTRVLVVSTSAAVMGVMFAERSAPIVPLRRGDDIRIMLGEIIVLAGGTLVGSMGAPSVPLPQLAEARGAATSAGGAIPDP